MDKSFRLSRRRAKWRGGSERKMSGLVLKKMFVLYLTKILLPPFLYAACRTRPPFTPLPCGLVITVGQYIQQR